MCILMLVKFSGVFDRAFMYCLTTKTNAWKIFGSESVIIFLVKARLKLKGVWRV